MDFVSLYADYHRKGKNRRKPEKCVLVTGHGGSMNIIGVGSNFAFKIIPHYRKNIWEKIQRNNDVIEPFFYKLLTQKIILQNKSPCIIGCYNIEIVDMYKKLLSTFKCPSIRKMFMVAGYQLSSNLQKVLCELERAHATNLIYPKAQMIVLERCSWSSSKMLIDLFKLAHVTKKEGLKKEIDNEDIFAVLDRFIFQIIFTLATIQENFPEFVHNDFFLRNILIRYETRFAEDAMCRWSFGENTWYLPANGFYAKINDFGFSVLKPYKKFTITKFESKDMIEAINQATKECPKCDIFNFLHDMYRGQNFGSRDLMTLCKARKSPELSKRVRLYMGQFLDINLLDQINTVNKKLLDKTWNISKIPFLMRCVHRPAHYLNGKIFHTIATACAKDRVVWTWIGKPGKKT